MGFEAVEIQHALDASDNDPELAYEFLCAVITLYNLPTSLILSCIFINEIVKIINKYKLLILEPSIERRREIQGTNFSL